MKLRWLNLIFRAAAFILMGLVAVFVLGSLAENRLGARAWSKYVAGAKARGEWFEPKDLIPAAVPDEQNFAAIPLFKPLFDYSVKPSPDGSFLIAVSNDPAGKKRLDEELKLCGTNSFSDDTNWRRGEFADLAAWQRFFRSQNDPRLQGTIGKPAEDILGVLAKFDPPINAVRLGAARPYSRFPIHFTELYMGKLDHLTALQDLSRILWLREKAEIALGKSAAAFEDAMLQFRLIEATVNEPFLLTLLVQTIQMEGALAATWEGIETHQWNDAQLANFDSALSRFDMIAEFAIATRWERIFDSFLLYDQFRTKSFTDLLYVVSWGAPGPGQRGRTEFLGHLLYPLKCGWLDFNKAISGEIIERWGRVADPKQHRFRPDVAVQTNLYVLSQSSGIGRVNSIVARGSSSIYDHLIQARLAPIQSAVDQARVAIALERYWLGHGTYPDALEQLSEHLPQIPHDLITGQPLHYRKSAKTGYVLYSVGWNGEDDGGVTIWKRPKDPHPNWTEGDWAWPRRRGERIVPDTI